MTDYWDLAVYNRDEQLVLVAEVKNKLNATPEWAAQLRRNILAHGVYPNAPYLLVALPDRFYLWTDSCSQSERTEPNYAIDARPLLQPYFDQVGVAADQISRQSLELIIASWLGNIVYSDQIPEQLDESERWLTESGLYAAILGGRFEHEVAA